MENDDQIASSALGEIGKIVERLQNNATGAEYDGEAQREFFAVSEDLRKYYDQLEKSRFIDSNAAFKMAALRIQQQADVVKENRDKLEQILTNFEAASQILAVLDDALVIAAAFKP